MSQQGWVLITNDLKIYDDVNKSFQLLKKGTTYTIFTEFEQALLYLSIYRIMIDGLMILPLAQFLSCGLETETIN